MPIVFSHLFPILTLGAALLLTACTENKVQAPTAPLAVKTISAVAQDENLWLEALGRAEGRREIQVVSRVSGHVARICYEEGRAVKAGEVLFQIDDAPYQAEVAAAEATLKQREAEVRQAERELARNEKLLASGSVSRKTYDDAVSTRDITRAQQRVAAAALRTARLNLGYTRVRAPSSGVAARALLNPGAWVSSATTTLTTLSQPQDLRVTFTISDRDVAGRPLSTDNAVRLFDDRGRELAGKLDYVASEVDPATSTLTLRAKLNGDAPVLPGQYVHVQLALERLSHVFRVPQSAVVQKPDGSYQLFVEKAGRVAARTVKLGTWKDADWIVLSGLSEGESVVVSNLQRLKDGTAVKATMTRPAPVKSSNPYVETNHGSINQL